MFLPLSGGIGKSSMQIQILRKKTTLWRLGNLKLEKFLGIPKKLLGIPKKFLGIPKHFLGISKKFLGIPKNF